MRGHLAVAACATLFFVSPTAFAADPISQESFSHRFYASVHGGWIFDSLSHNTATDTGMPPSALSPSVSDAIGKPGYRFGGAVGVTLPGNVFALEGEVGFSHAEIDHFNLISLGGVPAPANGLPATGSGSTWTGMINGIVSVPLGGAVTPYVGAGAGIAHFTANEIVAAGAVLDGSDTGFAYQLIAGANLAASQNTTVGARYRYLYIDGLSLMDGDWRHDFSTRAQSVEFVLTHQFGNN